MLERQMDRKEGRFNRILGIGMGALLLGALAWSMGRSFLPGPAAAQPSWRAPWEGPGPEPAARSWAAPLEPSLLTACGDASYAHRDPGRILWSVAQEVPVGDALSEQEKQELKGLLANSTAFGRPCLARAYRAIEPCAAYKADLAGGAARSCMAPAMTRGIAALPFELCVERTQSGRLRRACAAAREKALARAEEFLRNGARL